MASPFVTDSQRPSNITSVIISPLKFKEKEHWFSLDERIWVKVTLWEECGMGGDASAILWHMVCLRWWKDEIVHQGIFAMTCSTHSTHVQLFKSSLKHNKIALNIIKSGQIDLRFSVGFKAPPWRKQHINLGGNSVGLKVKPIPYQYPSHNIVL